MDHVAHFWKGSDAQKKQQHGSFRSFMERIRRTKKTAAWIISLIYGKDQTHKKKQQHGSFRSFMERIRRTKKTAAWIISPIYGKDQTHKKNSSMDHFAHLWKGSDAQKKQQHGSFRSFMERIRRTKKTAAWII